MHICTFGEDERGWQVTASAVNDRMSDPVLVPSNPPSPQHSAAVSSKQLQMISDEKKGAVTEKKTHHLQAGVGRVEGLKKNSLAAN